MRNTKYCRCRLNGKKWLHFCNKTATIIYREIIPMRKKSTDIRAYTESRTFAASMATLWSGKCVFAFKDGVMPAVRRRTVGEKRRVWNMRS